MSTPNAPLRVGFDVRVIGRGHLHPNGRTGLYRVTLELYRALGAAGVSLHPFAAGNRGEAEAELAYHGLEAPVRRSELERTLYPWARRMVPAGHPREAPLPAGLRKRYRTVVELLERWPGGAATGLEGDVDVFHSPYDPLFRSKLSPERGKPKVITVHDCLPLTDPQWFGPGDQWILEGVMDELRRGAWAHCVSEATRAAVLSLVPEAKDRCFVAGLAANPQIFHPPTPEAIASIRQKLGLSERGGYLLTLGRRDPRKNQDRAIETHRRLRERHPDLSLVIVGPAPPGFTEGAAADGVVPAGYLPDAELAAVYGGATAFLFPSYAEGFGLPILEAMSCGVPVLSSNRTSLPEVAGDAAQLLDPDDADHWVEATAQVLEDSALSAVMRARGLARVEAWSWDSTANQLISGYRRAVERAPTVN